MNNFECILIDDGDPECSIDSIKNIISSDERFKIIRHKSNTGLGSARNTGLRHAQGEYICFIDSDDYVHKDYLKILYETIIVHNADISMCSYTKSYRQSTSSNACESIVQGTTTTQNWITLMRKILLFHDEGGMWNRMYKKSLFTTIQFPDRFYEDIITNLKICIYNTPPKIVYTSSQLYFYCINKKSITTTLSGSHMNDYFINSIAEVIKLIYNNTFLPQYYKRFLNVYVCMRISNFTIFVLTHNYDLHKWYHAHLKTLLRNSIFKTPFNRSITVPTLLGIITRHVSLKRKIKIIISFFYIKIPSVIHILVYIVHTYWKIAQYIFYKKTHIHNIKAQNN